MSGQYSINKHTILPLIFKIAHANTLSYLLRDPITKSLILLPSSEDPQHLAHHVSNIQKQFSCKLTHSFLNFNAPSNHPLINQQKLIMPKSLPELRPELIGELSFCFINANGYTPDYNLIAVTHINPTSTKFPVLFVGNLLAVSSIDYQHQVRPQLYCKSLDKIKYFPNQTFIFPSALTNKDSLEFAQALNKNILMEQKINNLEKHGKEIRDCLIPTTVMEEKMLNPFLFSEKLAALTSTTDKIKSFNVLRQMRRQWRAQSL